MIYNILVIDDDEQFVNSVQLALKQFNVIPAYSTNEAKKKLSSEIDLVLLDLVFDENNPDFTEGLDFLPFIRQMCPDTQVVIMTNYPSKDKIVASIKSGAEDFFLKKELEWIEWEKRIENYCRNSRRIRELTAKTGQNNIFDESEIIGISDEINFVKRKLKDVAEHSEDISVFIQGETGTGKNLAVKYFRKYSIRKEKPFKEFSIVELSTTILESELFGHVKGAFTGADKDKTGLFEAANGGILFLDEIGDYDLSTQTKIMRFLENKTITPVGSTKSKRLNVQLLMATNKNIPAMIKEGKFREDFYQRINRVKIELPPLRERKRDIRILTEYFFNHFRIKEKTNLVTISGEVFEILNDYYWPGNVRELQSVIWEACGTARLYNEKTLQKKHLRKELLTGHREQINEDEATNLVAKKTKINAELELQEIDNALAKTYGQKSAAAQLLGLDSDRMRYRIMKYYQAEPDRVKKYNQIMKYYDKFLKK